MDINVPRNRAPDFLTIKEAADNLHVTYKTLYCLITGGNGPPTHVLNKGKRRLLRIKRADLDKWLEEKCTA